MHSRTVQQKLNAYRNLSDGGRDRYISATVDPYITFYDKFKNRHDLRGRWFVISKQGGSTPSIGNYLSAEYQFQRTFGQGWILTAGTMVQKFIANSILFNDNTRPELGETLKFGGESFAVFAQFKRAFQEFGIGH